MHILSYALPFIIVLSILVFVHELGHFLVARRYGVKVDVFSIGFGPEIFGFTDRHQTRWKFSVIPLGGYVKMFGDTNAASATSPDQVQGLSEDEKKLTLQSKSPAQRIAVAFAGPLANYMLAFVLLCGLIIFKGVPKLTNEIGTIDAAFPAAKAGLQSGDKVLRVDGQSITRFEELVPLIRKSAGRDLKIDIERKGQRLHINIPMYDAQTKKPIQQLGIRPSEPVYERMSPLYAMAASVDLCWSLSAQTFKSLGMLFQKNGGENLGGILSIGDMAAKSVQSGWSSLIWFMAVLSINLGFINLLPVPVLDGGHILMHSIELIRGRPLSSKMQERIFTVGFCLVLSLMLYATWNDLKRYKVVSFVTEIFQKK